MKNFMSTLARFALALFLPLFQLLTRHMQRSGLMLGVYNFPEGATFLFSNTFAAAKSIATMNNADPVVCGSTAHGIVDGDELLLRSGWEEATDTIWVADQLTADTFALPDLDTSDLAQYSPGGGANSSVQKISNWLEIPQVLTIDVSGGGVRKANVAPLKRRNALSFVLGFEPSDITLTLGHDAGNAIFKQMVKLSRKRAKVAFKMLLADGAATYGYGVMSVSEVPRLSNGNANTVTVGFSMEGRAISRAAA